MTLLDAPEFNEARDRRHRKILWGSAITIAAVFVAFWLVSGRPVDWPWNWCKHLRGRHAINAFLGDVERNDMAAAYAVWLHDPNWQQHRNQTGPYTFARFQQDWSSESHDNEYGAIRSHKIAAARMSGNVLLIGIWINGSKSKPLFLDYDPKTRTLSFSPVELYLGP